MRLRAATVFPPHLIDRGSTATLGHGGDQTDSKGPSSRQQPTSQNRDRSSTVAPMPSPPSLGMMLPPLLGHSRVRSRGGMLRRSSTSPLHGSRFLGVCIGSRSIESAQPLSMHHRHANAGEALGVIRGGEAPRVALVQAATESSGLFGQRPQAPPQVRLQGGPLRVEPRRDAQAFPLINRLRALVGPASLSIDGGGAVRLRDYGADPRPVGPQEDCPQTGEPMLHGQLVPARP
jgi:hypothetical protein